MSTTSSTTTSLKPVCTSRGSNSVWFTTVKVGSWCRQWCFVFVIFGNTVLSILSIQQLSWKQWTARLGVFWQDDLFWSFFRCSRFLLNHVNESCCSLHVDKCLISLGIVVVANILTYRAFILKSWGNDIQSLSFADIYWMTELMFGKSLKWLILIDSAAF